MKVKIDFVERGQEDDFIDLYCSAFARPEADMIMPMMYPMGLGRDSLEVRARLKASLLASTKGDPSSECLFARDEESGKIVGICWWQPNLNPPTTNEEMNAERADARETLLKLPPVEGMNIKLAEAYLEVSLLAQHEVTQQQPHVELRMLAVHPDFQGHGIASQFIKEGLKQADAAGLPVFVVASVQGKPIYEHYGFDLISDLPLDCREYGGYSAAWHWSMLRPARTT